MASYIKRGKNKRKNIIPAINKKWLKYQHEEKVRGENSMDINGPKNKTNNINGIE